MREFGFEIPKDTEVRVWDSTAEVRYLVLPERPGGTDTLTEEQLASLVTRDSMIGVGVAQASLPGENP
jgi:nitrile hydratase